MTKLYWFFNSIIFIVVLIGMIIFFNPTESFAYNLLIPSQTIYQIRAGSAESVKFKIYSNEILRGSFITTENITVYLLTPYEYFRLGQSPFSYLDTTGKVSSGSVSWLLNPGIYYLVFDNRNIILETNVMIQNPFILRPL
jgi:hypothetical protein